MTRSHKYTFNWYFMRKNPLPAPGSTTFWLSSSCQGNLPYRVLHLSIRLLCPYWYLKSSALGGLVAVPKNTTTATRNITQNLYIPQSSRPSDLLTTPRSWGGLYRQTLIRLWCFDCRFLFCFVSRQAWWQNQKRPCHFVATKATARSTKRSSSAERWTPWPSRSTTPSTSTSPKAASELAKFWERKMRSRRTESSSRSSPSATTTGSPMRKLQTELTTSDEDFEPLASLPDRPSRCTPRPGPSGWCPALEPSVRTYTCALVGLHSWVQGFGLNQTSGEFDPFWT